MTSIIWEYVHKLENENSIDEFEQIHNIKYPDDLKECIKKNNAGTPNLNIFDAKKTKENIFGYLLSFNKADSENIYDIYPQFQKSKKKLLPFANDPFGNFLCVSLGKIVLWDYETDSCEYVAENFTEFLSKLYGN